MSDGEANVNEAAPASIEPAAESPEIQEAAAETQASSPPAATPPTAEPTPDLPPTPPVSAPYDPGSAPISPSEIVAPATSHGASTPPISISSFLAVALEKIQFNKRKKLDKILRLAEKYGRIKNDDVEKLLRVSDSTAARYLKQLVQEGKLKVTKTRNDAFYELV